MRSVQLKSILLVCAGTLLISTPADAAYTIRQGHLVNAKEMPTMSIQEHYSLATAAQQNGDYKEAARQFRVISNGFPETRIGQEAFYHLAKAYYRLGDFDFANQAVDQYLQVQQNPVHFEDAIRCKFHIAERFAEGAKRHLLGSKHLPRVAPATKQAGELYDQVIASLPSHDLAAKALFAKAKLQESQKDFRGAVDSLQKLCKRFPKHELAPQGYLAIASVYREQARLEGQNRDLMILAANNLASFRMAFPADPRVAQAEQDHAAVIEHHARGLYETGQFYERTNRPRASVLYYSSAINRFPQTEVAKQCRARLKVLQQYVAELELPAQEEAV